MTEREWLERHYEAQRRRLHAVAYRMLGSVSDAEDAVQTAWLRMSGVDGAAVEDAGSYMTTVVARVCLNMLRSRSARREGPLDIYVPDPIVSPDSGADPEHEALIADSVGLALLVVLDTLNPAERLAFVLHDMFGVPYEEIAPMIDRKPAAARQLASRARRQVRGQAPQPDTDIDRQRAVTAAFFAAARDGDFDALVSVLHPNVVLRSDGGEARDQFSVVIRGAHEVAGQALRFGVLFPFVRSALINGAAGVVVVPDGRPLCVMGFSIVKGRIVAIDVLNDPDRLKQLDLSGIDR
jgi:RNA polymerase sigma factor (sigma-70 family)